MWKSGDLQEIWWNVLMILIKFPTFSTVLSLDCIPRQLRLWQKPVTDRLWQWEEGSALLGSYTVGSAFYNLSVLSPIFQLRNTICDTPHLTQISLSVSVTFKGSATVVSLSFPCEVIQTKWLSWKYHQQALKQQKLSSQSIGAFSKCITVLDKWLIRQDLYCLFFKTMFFLYVLLKGQIHKSFFREDAGECYRE